MWKNKIKKLNTPNQGSKFKTINWVKINHERNENNHIRFKTPILRSGLCDHRDAYIYFKRTITVTDTAAQRQPNNCANK